MKIRVAKPEDSATILEYDKHIRKKELCSLIELDRVLIAESKGNFIGWLRWNLFWDNTPFLNMLYLLDGYRNKGYGKEMVVSRRSIFIAN